MRPASTLRPLASARLFQRRVHVTRQAEAAREVDAGAARQEAEFGRPAALLERLQQPVGHFAGRAVAASRNHQIEAAGGKVERQPFGVAFGLRFAQLEIAEVLFQRRGDLRPTPFQPAATGNRIENHPDFQYTPSPGAEPARRSILCRH